MANRTVKYATSVHGTNPQYLIEKIIRSRIYESKYWKEHCTLLNSALVLEKAVDDVKYVGGVYGGNIKPTPFLCLALKLLQIQPQRDIIYLFIEQSDFKYLRALGAFYLRLVGKPVEVHLKLEPLLRDYRKLRVVDRMHNFSVIHLDELVDNLLRENRVFDVILPRLTKRYVLEENGELEPYKSELEEQNLIPSHLIEEKLEQAKHERVIKTQTQPRFEKQRYSESATSSNKSRFRQEEIDSENAIRAKLGLKPLRHTGGAAKIVQPTPSSFKSVDI